MHVVVIRDCGVVGKTSLVTEWIARRGQDDWRGFEQSRSAVRHGGDPEKQTRSRSI